MKKKIIIILILLVILLFPLKYHYKDGGTIEYKAIFYNVIKWHSLDNNYDNCFKTGIEIHLFPDNFKAIDYYMNTMPQRLEIYYNDEKYYGDTLSYKWCNDYDNCTESTVVLANNFEFEGSLVVNKKDVITIMGSGELTDFKAYTDSMDKPYEKELDYSDEYIKVPEKPGNYAFILKEKNGENTVQYLIKIIVR